MPSEYACDTSDGNQATISINNMQTGDVQFLCTPCAGLFGVTLVRELYPEMWTELTAPAKPAAAAKPRTKSGKVAVTPDEPGRVIATITETGIMPDPEPGEVVGSDAGDLAAAAAERLSEARPDADDPAPY